MAGVVGLAEEPPRLHARAKMTAPNATSRIAGA